MCVLQEEERETKVSSRLDTINIINPVLTLEEPVGHTHTYYTLFFSFECGKRDHEALSAHEANKSQRKVRYRDCVDSTNTTDAVS